MRKRISALIIDNKRNEHNYDNVFMKNVPEWFENGYDITVIDDSKNVLSELNKIRGVDSIITIGNDVNCSQLNDLSFEYRKKWCHIDEFDVQKIENTIVNTFLYNINRDRKNQKLFSVFTSTFNTQPKMLKRLYESLLNQTYKNWNWWVIDDSTNNHTSEYLEKLHDPRITVIKNVTNHGNIGFNKHMIAMLCDGDYLVEVDHDDELTHNCLSSLYECFEKSNADFVYSDCLEIIDGTTIYYGDDFSYGQGYYRDCEVNGVIYENVPITCRSINVKSVRGIHALPNHIRCWKKDFYHKIGGHNTELSVLDDMDLLIRTFLYGRMAKVDKVLYIQHQGNTQSNGRGNTATGARLKEIQRVNWMLRNKYDLEIHNRIIELGIDDIIWDDEKQISEVHKNVNIEDLKPMDILITN
jgi:glycosyltransferase involved in cell wall biosynthesis